MIPLGPGEIPVNGDELTARISAVLDRALEGGGARPKVSCEMTSPDRIDLISIDISQVETAGTKMQRPTGFTQLGAAEVGKLSVKGDPTLLHGAPVVLRTEGTNVPMAWTRDDHGSLWLVPARTGAGAGGDASGHVEVAAEIAQIERAAKVAIAAMAEQQGAKLKDLQLKITPAGARGLAIRADVSASKFMMTAKVALTAEATLDDNMNLRIARLNVAGDGAAGAMVANMLADKVRQFEGKQVDLGQFVFAGARLRDVDLQVDNRVRLTARFGA